MNALVGDPDPTTLDPEDMLDNFLKHKFEVAEAMALELLHKGNFPLLYRVYAHLVLAHGDVDALYHAFRAVANARDGVHNFGEQSDGEEIVEVYGFAQEILQDVLEIHSQNELKKFAPANAPVVHQPEPPIPCTPQTPRRSIRNKTPTTPRFFEPEFPRGRKPPQKIRSPRKNRALAAKAHVEAYYTIRGILDETKTDYLVDWEDIGSQSFPPTWEPKSNITDMAMQVWDEEKKQKEEMMER